MNKETKIRWVKASERLPEKRHNYHVKVSAKVYGLKEYHYNTARLFNGEYFEKEGYPDEKENVIEWLEEIEEPEEEQSPRPKIQDYFGKDATLEQVYNTYLSQPELFKYAQALDNYIDEITNK